MNNDWKSIYTFGWRTKTIIRNRIDLINYLCDISNRIIIEFEQESIDFSKLNVNDIYNCKIDIYKTKKQGIKIFETSENSIFSINYPFSINKTNKMITLDNNSITLNSKIISYISQLVSIFENQNFDFIDIFCKIDELNGELNNNEQYDVWFILYKLLTFDACYIRYDYDIKHQNGSLHPLYHLDINYDASFKLGLNNECILEDIHDILNSETDAYFLTKQ